jgi:RimJ/RimL family protein N-acetyltransferase
VPYLRILTERLELVAATAELARAAWEDTVQFGRMLQATVPPEWPPPLTEDTLEFTTEFLEGDPELVGWLAWYFIQQQGRVLIGQGGFKGKASEEGMVEVGYSVLPYFQGRGYATEAARGLIEWAFADARVSQVTAETLPHLIESIRVMEKNGLQYLGEDKDQGIVRYGRLRQ